MSRIARYTSAINDAATIINYVTAISNEGRNTSLKMSKPS